MPHLQELISEGHKALVFSQFTSMLSILREHLDRQGIVYEYLDGKTRDRKARVNHFQDDPDCPVFLISLKAGGLGLNLTAADYVFLLDPWWNPAVEAHREVVPLSARQHMWTVHEGDAVEVVPAPRTLELRSPGLAVILA